jgi:hypothetical protein
VKRKAAVAIERLEDRSLPSGLAYSLTTNRAVYHAGQPVEFSFTATNTSGSPVNVGWGQVGFAVSQNGHEISVVAPIAMVMPLLTLKPGQSATETLPWNGLSKGPPPAQLTGQFTVKAVNTTANLSTNFAIERPASSSSPITVAVTANHATHVAGRPVHITATLTNVSNGDVTLTPDHKADGVTILDGTTAVWSTRAVLRGRKIRTLRSGQSLRLSVVWNGQANQPGVEKLSSGIYTILFADGGYGGVGTLHIT